MSIDGLVPRSCRRTLARLVVHCSATPSGRRLEPDAARVIDRWHAQRGFRRSAQARARWMPAVGHMGYHYVVNTCGTVQAGRHLDEIGAHAAGHNADSVGICLVGGVEREGRYTLVQWEQLAFLVRALRMCAARSGMGLIPRVLGHRDLSPDANGDGVIDARDWLKTCPGFEAPAWYRSGMVPPPAHTLET